MKTKSKIPALRFKGFTDAWEQRKLSDVANHRGGTAIEKYFDKDGVYKVISIGSYGLNSQYVDQNIRAISNEITDGRVVNSGELTMVLNDKTANGTIIGRTLLVEKDNEYVINQRTEIISPKENFDSNFAYTILNGPFREKVKRIVQGGTQIYVNYPAVSNLNLELPKIEEQQKIGSFFKQLDNTIALHQRKCDQTKELKKTMLQKMFPKKGERIPEIRFPEFTDEWEEKKLGEVVDREIKGKAKANMQGTKSIYLETEYLNGGETTFVDSDADIEEDDILILWDGSQAGTVYHGFFGALGSTLKAYRPKESGKFVYYQLVAHQEMIFQRYRTPNIPHVIKTFTEEFSVFTTSLPEQERIGNFFKQLDNIIALHQRKLDLLKEQKKGFLQKMFPKNGEKVPELRFAGFADDWEERKLGDLLKEFSIKSTIENEYKVLSSTNSGMEFREGRVSGTSNLGYKIIKNGDLVLSPQNLWLGNININNLGKGLVSPSYKTFELINIDSSFINPQLRTQKMLEEYKNSSTQGASVVRRNLEIDSFYQIKIFVPTISEQEKIGSFFKQLDNTIALHQRKLDLLKEQKKGFLQKMFV